MNRIKKLNEELKKLINNFNQNEISLDETLIKFERLIKDFQLLSDDDYIVKYKIKENFNSIILKIDKMKSLKDSLIKEQELNKMLRAELGLN